MSINNRKIYDVIIIGAGHGGLSVSHFLKAKNIQHLVFERGKIGESWRSQRWDSFALNTPNWLSTLPGDTYKGDFPEGFLLRDEFVDYLNDYADRFKLPVKEESQVISVIQRSKEGFFEVNYKNIELEDKVYCKQLVLASGVMSAPKTPSISADFPEDIGQLHAATYKNPGLLPAGAVLVVGSGQSGCQIAEDLLNAGKKVYLATSKVGRLPRRYRGKDIMDWAVKLKFFELTTETVTDPKILKSPQPQVSGLGRFGHTVSLQDLHRQGASIMGRLENINGYEAEFGTDAAEHVRFADEFSQTFKKMIDDYIHENKIALSDGEDDQADSPDPSAACVESAQALNLQEKRISTVIWTTGFTADFSWISPSVTNEAGMPIHTNGISPVAGIYYIGFPWLKSRKSGIVYGVNEDAQYIAENIIQRL